MTKTLFNKGKRRIDGKGFSMEPNSAVSFEDAAEADRIKNLFPGEVIDIDDVKSQFVADTANAVKVDETAADPVTAPKPKTARELAAEKEAEKKAAKIAASQDAAA